MNNFRKVLLVFVFVLFLLVFLSYKEFFSPYFTEYTKDFSIEKFLAVNRGMEEGKVIDLIGKPFYSYQPGLRCGQYSRAKSALTDFFGWVSMGICYDEENKVQETARNVFFN